jgi:predicted nucleic acid-binding protein
LIHFLDTSALAKRYLREPGSRELRSALRRAHVAVARITYAEALAAVARAHREGMIDTTERGRIFDAIGEDFRELTVIEVRGATLAPVPELVVRHPLRGYDAVQLACALAVRRAGAAVTFWSADARLCDAAKGEGLRTVGA